MSCDCEELRRRGYARTSNKHRVVARIDRPDWRGVLAASHVDGMDWVRALGDSAADHYRRCLTTDRHAGCPCADRLPTSNAGPTEYRD